MPSPTRPHPRIPRLLTPPILLNAVVLRPLLLIFITEVLVDVGFEVGDGATVGTQEVGPGVPVQDGTDALVVPDVGAGGYEEGLAGLFSHT
ncbi:MAG: hypothetical protein INR71_13055 [Terriglobus roseus]|nr:hypothetical protein [Terriglobus roseus]